MTCSESIVDMNKVENFKCMGYTNVAGRIEIAVSLKNGKGSAKIHNLNKNNFYYLQTEGMILPCNLSTI